MSNRAVLVDPNAPGRLALGSVPAPEPARHEAIVRVRAVSLNRGEVRRSQAAAPGWRPGWDFAGDVERAAADGSGPPQGSRVVGLLPEGSWAERIAAPTQSIADLPGNVTFAQAATLPVAGLTALYALSKGGLLLARRVLVTGASGGVGDFAVALARLAGAHVSAALRRPGGADAARERGAHEVVIGEEIPASPKYDLIVESVGGRTLASALGALARGGICVTFGVSAGDEVTFDPRQLFGTGRASLYGLTLFNELAVEPASVGLRRLVDLVASGQLQPQISVERPWAEIGSVADDLMARRFSGKAVLTVDR